MTEKQIDELGAAIAAAESRKREWTATMTTLPDLIVTRHEGLLRWLCAHLPAPAGTEWVNNGHELTRREYRGGEYVRVAGIPVTAHATPADVRDRHVVGVLPLSLARHAASVTEVEMPGLRPDQRGAELTPDEMDAAGARLGEPVVVLDRRELTAESAGAVYVLLEPLPGEGFAGVRDEFYSAAAAAAAVSDRVAATRGCLRPEVRRLVPAGRG